MHLYKKSYDYKVSQHPFSYFRGTLLKDVLNPNSPKCKKPMLADSINDLDVSLWDTKLGKNFKDKINIDFEKVDTKIKSIKSTPQKPINIKAYKFVSKSGFGKFTAKALTRTPVIGLGVSALIEIPEIVCNIVRGEKAIKAIGKGVARWGSSVLLTGICGTIGSFAGPVGSLIGIAVGGYLSSLINEKLINAYL